MPIKTFGRGERLLYIMRKPIMRDLADRLRYRVQLTTDGHKAYLSAVEEAVGADIDYSQLIKIYGPPLEADTRYSPGECTGCKRERVSGRPDPLHVSTSYVERQNLTMRMSMRRFTRLTNAFSKKIENHAAAVAVFYMHYNFARIHQTLRVTPAMAAGVTDHVWELEEIIRLIPERKPGKRGPYKKKEIQPDPLPEAGPGNRIDFGFTAGELPAETPIGALLDALRNGQTYVLLHSETFPGGEVRGQIELDVP